MAVLINVPRKKTDLATFEDKLIFTKRVQWHPFQMNGAAIGKRNHCALVFIIAEILLQIVETVDPQIVQRSLFPLFSPDVLNHILATALANNKNVHAVAANKRVVSNPVAQNVIAVIAIDRVVPFTAADRVSIIAAAQATIVVTGIYGIVTILAINRVLASTARDSFVVIARKDSVVAFASLNLIRSAARID